VENARHANDIVQRIRGAAAKHTPERGPLNLNEVVDESEMFVRHEIDFRSIELRKVLQSDMPRVLADRVQLQQVIVNLLVNSIQAITQANEEQGWVELGTEVDGHSVILTVRDSGPGIADSDLNRVFEGFFTTKEEGVGIGLAICESILIAHGGNISVSNDSKGGALFRVSLPIIDTVPEVK
jgi:C4-dicarboxylate-specific signal transduction histidine kinase